MDSMKITLQLPAKELQPNFRCHYMAKARKTKLYRTMAMYQAISGINQANRNRKDDPVGFNWKEATAQATFYFRVKRKRDKDNYLASLKAVFDGIADAGLIADDSGLTHLPRVFKMDKLNPRVEIVIRKG